MNKYLIGYQCYFSLGFLHTMTVEANNKEEALEKAIATKKANMSSSIEVGGVKYNTFKVLKKLNKNKKEPL